MKKLLKDLNDQHYKTAYDYRCLTGYEGNTENILTIYGNAFNMLIRYEKILREFTLAGQPIDLWISGAEPELTPEARSTFTNALNQALILLGEEGDKNALAY